MDTKINSLDKKRANYLILLLTTSILLIILVGLTNAATPQGPDTLASVNNSTKGNVSAKMFNVSGGYISTFNLSATVQNNRWKAFIGNVTGSFTLDDATGATIYDWTLSTISGRVYATRNASTVTWSSIVCANNSTMESENSLLGHSNIDDNITITFKRRLHPAFSAAGESISANQCPTLRPYVNDVAQSTQFNETVLYDGVNHVYSTQLEVDQTGYDGKRYDFQMIVPENGTSGFSSATAYYLYIELE